MGRLDSFEMEVLGLIVGIGCVGARLFGRRGGAGYRGGWGAFVDYFVVQIKVNVITSLFMKSHMSFRLKKLKKKKCVHSRTRGLCLPDVRVPAFCGTTIFSELMHTCQT